jgi:hypothetical protein
MFLQIISRDWRTMELIAAERQNSEAGCPANSLLASYYYRTPPPLPPSPPPSGYEREARSRRQEEGEIHPGCELESGCQKAGIGRNREKVDCETVKLPCINKINNLRGKISQFHSFCVSAKL